MSFHIQEEFYISSLPIISKQNVPSMKNKHKKKYNVDCTCVYSMCMPVHYVNTTVISPLKGNFSP